MSAALVILPVVWAVEETTASRLAKAEETPQRQPLPEMAFYRKYTEALLRRFVRLSMEAGRTPSLLGKEILRGKASSYRVHGFDDVVIFVHDVGRCVERLDEVEQYLVRRIAMQEFTQQETAEMSGMSLRSVHRRYADALDRLTEIFLEKKLLEPGRVCRQGGERMLEGGPEDEVEQSATDGADGTTDLLQNENRQDDPQGIGERWSVLAMRSSCCFAFLMMLVLALEGLAA